jgi:hypothetical protein
VDKPLTSTPHFYKAIIGLSLKALLLIFSLFDGLFSENEAVECPRRPLFSESWYLYPAILASNQLDEYQKGPFMRPRQTV